MWFTIFCIFPSGSWKLLRQTTFVGCWGKVRPVPQTPIKDTTESTLSGVYFCHRQQHQQHLFVISLVLLVWLCSAFIMRRWLWLRLKLRLSWRLGLRLHLVKPDNWGFFEYRWICLKKFMDKNNILSAMFCSKWWTHILCWRLRKGRRMIWSFN